MTKLPDLASKYTTLMRQRKLEPDDTPLKLVIEHGSRKFKITLKIPEGENGDPISMRHLAQMVLCETGIIPREQKFYYKGVSFENPDMGPWSPALKDLGIKNGDRIQLVSFHKTFPDWENMRTMEEVEKQINEITAQKNLLFYHLQGVHSGFMECGNQVMALTYLRKDFDNIKEKLLNQIQILNSLHFDHRNSIGQAKRRELVDYCQRQVDKCSDMAATIFHKLAQAHYLSNSGKMYPRDIRLSPSRNIWPKKQGL